MNQSGKDDELSDAATEKRRDAALLRALSTPHKRQKEMKIGKSKGKSLDVPESEGRGSEKTENA
jgi:hypothetical protein